MPYANLQINFDDEDLELALQDLKNCINKLPFMVNLTNKEKSSYMRMGSKSTVFIKTALMYYQTNPNLQLPVLNLTEWQNDFDNYRRLEILLAQAQTLVEGISDTVIALRMENMAAARGFYKIAQMAATQNVPGIDAIVQDLRPMMPGLKKYRKKNKDQAPKQGSTDVEPEQQ